MQSPARNIHATALVLGTTGILVTGPSGAGKSSLALGLIAAAQRSGCFARLVADDRVLLATAGGHLIAAPPPTLAGQVELRGTGVITVPYLKRAVLHLAIGPAALAGPDRVPPAGETFQADTAASLPLLRLDFARHADAYGSFCLFQRG